MVRIAAFLNLFESYFQQALQVSGFLAQLY